ncbi:MAG TPA: peptidoglycan DD-metalloendopeptidase family protein [Candidatus Krumholzibacteria bacterium]|nr:peptidoglycan DD-metalloendopeptidase family protein [Candidatus Krumholzibacteria bacterium]
MRSIASSGHPKPRLSLWLVALLLLGVLKSTPVSAQSQNDPALDDKQQQLEQLRSEIKKSRNKANALAQDEGKQLKRLQALEQEAADTKKLLDGLNARQDELLQEVSSLQSEIARSDSSASLRRARLASQLRHMYMYRSQSTFAVLATSGELDQLGRKMRAMTSIARAERSFIEDIQESRSVLQDKEAELDERLAQLEQNRGQVQQQRARVDALKQERREQLDQIKKERNRWDSSLKELQQSAAQLEDLMTQLEKQGQKHGAQLNADFPALKGQLIMPVAGSITQGFGRSVHPRFKTVVVNRGINIAAAMGAPIRVVAQGVVDYVNWLPGYGKCIIVNHGDGWYTLYAHCSQIFPAVSATVQSGEVIAEVGDTGSLDGSQLYFEIRHGKTPVDPAPWFRR